MSKPIVAITGGTGFLGRHVIEALVAAGWHVRALVRRNSDRPAQAHPGFEAIIGDVGDRAALSLLVRDAQAVVHAAGLVKASGAAHFFAVNRDGTAALADIVAREAASARFVLVSSQAARMPALSAYAASKRAGEDAAIAALPADRLVILRPCVVYGPWDREGVALLRLARQRLVPVPTAPEPRVAMIHVRDAAAAIVAVCATGSAGATYEISDARVEGYPWREIVETAAPSFGPTRHFLPLPDFALLAAGTAADGWARITRKPILFGRGKAREILHRDWRSGRALQPPPEIWAPAVGLREGLAETLAWWQDNAARAG